MKPNLTIDYINNNATKNGIIELDSGDYYHICYLPEFETWVAGDVCNVGMLAQYWYDAAGEDNEQALAEFIADLEEVDRGGIPSGQLYSVGGEQ